MKVNVEELQELVRSGNFEEAAARLRLIGKCDRKDAATLGNLAWRMNQPALGVKILNPIVRPKNKIQEPATQIEKAEYAEALRRLGAVDEAWQLLNEVDDNRIPQAMLYKIFCLFNRWRYEESLPLVRKYVQIETLEPYARSVGQINLAAALIQVGNLTEASDWLKRIREETLRSNFTLLYGNALELSAQLCILQKDFDGALAVLADAAGVLKGAGSVFSLFVQKWKAIAESLKAGRPTEELREVLLNAQAIKHWETVRDCDLYIARLEGDSGRFTHLYFGTPYESFRKRILTFAGPNFEVAGTYVCSLMPNPSSVFELSSGRVSGAKKGSLPIGQALHRFMILLCRDLYRPLPVLSAFGLLFPDEYTSLETSANRVHQVVKRCREWIGENGLDFQIHEESGAYRLVLGTGVGIALPSELLPLDTNELACRLLEKQLGFERFEIHHASQVLSYSNSSTQRILRWANENGRVEKIGKGSRTAYRMINRAAKSD